jgi:hypothetical protein
MKPAAYKLYVIGSDPIVSVSSGGWSTEIKTTVDNDWDINFVCKIAKNWNYNGLILSVNLHSFYEKCTKEDMALLTSTFQCIEVKPNSIDEKWLRLLLDASSPSYCLKTLRFQFTTSLLHDEPATSTIVYAAEYIEQNYKIRSLKVWVGKADFCIVASTDDERYIKKFTDKIKEVLDRNKSCVENCRKACLYLIAARKYKECNLVHLPKEIVKMISLEIWKTRNESIWVEDLSK